MRAPTTNRRDAMLFQAIIRLAGLFCAPTALHGWMNNVATIQGTMCFNAQLACHFNDVNQQWNTCLKVSSNAPKRIVVIVNASNID